MSNKDTIFFRKNKEIKVNFLSEEISSDTSAILLEKIERKHKLIESIGSIISDNRNKSYVTHSLKAGKRVTIDINATDDPTHGSWLLWSIYVQTINIGQIL